MKNSCFRSRTIANGFLSSLLCVALFLFNNESLSAQDVSSASYVQKLDLFPTITGPSGISLNSDGSKVFISGNPGTGNGIALYDLGTNYDLSTAVYNSTVFLDVTADGDLQPNDLAFSANGTTLFVLGTSLDFSTFDLNEEIFSYTLSTGFDLSTASFNTNKVITLDDNFTTGIALNDDGSKMFITGSENNAIIEYTMSTDYDLSTASASGNTFDISGQTEDPHSLRFSEDGMTMFVVHLNQSLFQSDIFTYTLTTAFDITTASYAGAGESLSLNFNNVRPLGLAFGGNAKMFLVGTDNDGAPIWEYDLATTPIDVTAPSVAITSSASDPTNVSPIPVTITFDEEVTDFEVGELTIGNGSAGNFTTSDNIIFTADITPTADGEVTVDVSASVAQDLAGNDNTAATTFAVEYDITAPTIVITSGTTDPTNVSPIPVTITFSEEVADFAGGELTIGNGSAGNFTTSDNIVFTADITPSADGEVTVDVSASVAQDLAGNDNTAATTFAVEYDVTAPTVVITSGATDPTNVSPIPVTITFSEEVADFEVGELTIGNGSAGNFTTSDNIVFTADISPSADGEVTVDVSASVAQDLAGNDNTVATTFSVDYDVTAPTVVITSGASDPTNVSPIPVTITFSEEVADFEVGELTIGNGSAGNFTTSDNIVFTADITPSADGEVTVDVSASVAQDLAGNDNTAATTFAVEYDITAPVVTVDALTTNVLSPELTGTIDDASATVEVTVDGNDYTATNNGSTWSLAAGTIDPDLDEDTYDVTVTSIDVLGNEGIDTSSDELIIDITSPVAHILLANESVNDDFTIFIGFVEPDSDINNPEQVIGLDISDIEVVGATKGTLSSFGNSYTLEISPDGSEIITIDIAAGVVEDLAGNENEAAAQIAVTFDDVAPTVIIEAPATYSYYDLSAFSVSFEFSEVLGSGDAAFALADIHVENGTVANLAPTSDPLIYTADIAPDGGGDVSISLLPSSVQDEAGNAYINDTQGIVSLEGPFSGGEGSEANPYEIATETDLINLGENNNFWDKYFIQTNDIIFENSNNFTPIGSDETPFSGSYDGANHTISDLEVSGTGLGGLFAIGKDAIFKNIGLIDVNIDVSVPAGGLVAVCERVSIANCFATGLVNGSNAGGLVGSMNNGTIGNSYSTVSVSGSSYVGGLVGSVYYSGVDHSYSAGLVSDGTVTNGFIGYAFLSSFTNNYWDTESSNQNFGAEDQNFNLEINGIAGRNTSDMQIQSTFGGWDFTSTWQMDNGCVNNRYPILKWQDNPEPLIVDLGGDVEQCGGTATLDAGNAGATFLWSTGETTQTIDVTESGAYSVTVNDGSACGDVMDEIEVEIRTFCYSADNNGDFGNGSEGMPFLISNKEDLLYLSMHDTEWDYHFLQTEDITLTPTDYEDQEKGFSPIGIIDNSFGGSYDGDHHLINGLFINRPEGNHIGLFGQTNSAALINNLGLVNVEINGNNSVGGLIGINRGEVNNVYVLGEVNGKNTVGGLIGYDRGIVSNSFASCSITAYEIAGGLIGFSEGTIRNTYAAGLVHALLQVGGLIGVSFESGTIENSYASSAVSAEQGILVGGFIGEDIGVSVLNSFWSIDNNDQNIRGVGSDEDFSGVTGLTTAEIQTELTFTDADWDFTSTWQMDNGCVNNGFPILQWQDNPAGITINLGDDISQCEGTVLLDAGNPDATYLWSTGATTQTIQVSESGTYSVTVSKETAACDGTDEIEVTLFTAPTLELGDDVTNCGLYNIRPTINGEEISDGTGFDFEWQYGDETETTFDLFLLNSTAEVVVHEVTLTVTNEDGCTATDNVTITLNPVTVAYFEEDEITQCAADGPVTLQTNVTDGLTFLWSGPGVAEGTTTPSIEVTESGTYSVAYTNAFGCSHNDEIEVTINENPVVTIEAPDPDCGEITLEVGAFDGATYAWTVQGSTDVLGTNQMLTITNDGNADIEDTYEVTVTSADGCETVESTEVTVYSLPKPTLASVIEECGEVVLDGGVFSTYSWKDATDTEVGTEQTLTVTTSGDYTLTVTNESDCEVTQATSVTVFEQPTIDLGEDITECDSYMLSGPDGFASYSWSNGENTQSTIVTTSDTYTLTVTDENGCTAQDEVVVTIDPLPTFTVTGPTNEICARDEFTLTATPSAGTVAWYDAASGGNELSTDASLTTSSSSVGANRFWVEATDGDCASPRTAVMVNITYCYSGGSGTATDPYLIGNEDDLRYLSATPSDYGAHFLQIADIEMSENEFVPVGIGESHFTGTYDGGGHVIDKLSNVRGNFIWVGTWGGFSLQGLFAVVNNGVVLNLGVTNLDLDFSIYSGGIVGVAINDVELINCYSTGSMGTGGGLVGVSMDEFAKYNATSRLTIKNSFSVVTFKSNSQIAGGLVASANNSIIIRNSYSKADISLIENNVESGGLVASTIGNTVSAGLNHIIENSYFAGKLPTNTQTNNSRGVFLGLAHEDDIEKITNSFWDAELSGVETSAGGGTGLTTAEMKDPSTYFNAGWDFKCVGTEEIWNLDLDNINGGYPILSWQTDGEDDCVLILSAEEDETLDNTKVYPSVTNGLFTITLEGNKSVTQVEIVDMMGRSVYTQEYTQAFSEIDMDLSDEKSGIYIVKIQKGGSHSIHRIVLQK